MNETPDEFRKQKYQEAIDKETGLEKYGLSLRLQDNKFQVIGSDGEQITCLDYNEAPFLGKLYLVYRLEGDHEKIQELFNNWSENKNDSL